MKKNKIEHYSDKEALEFHNYKKSGKIEIISSKPMITKRDLALDYSPGVAATVKAKGVVIFGGFIPPEITGYDFHTNLFTGGEACGSRYSCKHCKAAMEAIGVDEVVEHMRKIIDV